MKKLFLKGFSFLAIILFLCAIIIFLSTCPSYRTSIAKWTASEEFMDANEMLPYFDRVRTPDQTTQLIIGDSICRQMFANLTEHNPQMSIQATNAALMITGQYLLVEEYLKYHPDATDVFLIMHPMPLTRTFDTEWSYRYAVMTYVETDTIGYLDQNTIQSMNSVYGRFFMQKGTVQLIEDSPFLRKLYLSYININQSDYVQSSPYEIADQYVKKMYDLCSENDVVLHVYPSPVSYFYKDDILILAEQYDSTWMSSQYPDYFNDILYYPDEWSEDLSHFSGDYATRDMLNEIIGRAYSKTALLEDLSFGTE